MGSIPQRWRLLSGQNNWQGLLNPLDHDLGSYLIHYGEAVQAIYDSFVTGGNSISKDHFFFKTGLGVGQNPFKYYVIKKEFYATSIFMGASCGVVRDKDKDEPGNPVSIAGSSKWLGFVAVANEEGKKVLGRRDILIAFRGTMTTAEACIDAYTSFVSASQILGSANNPSVHAGWYKYYTATNAGSTYNKTSCRDQILSTVRSLVNQYKGEQMSITVAGHSMGAALATLNATDIVRNGLNKPAGMTSNADCPVTAFVYACPRLGNAGFGKVFSGLASLRTLRIRNRPDPVPRYPPKEIGYIDVGQELVIDTSTSPFLRDYDVTAHALQVYLFGLMMASQLAKGSLKLRDEADHPNELDDEETLLRASRL
ncbi:hypothetical protein UlMin_001575 [Ulmus minor]